MLDALNESEPEPEPVPVQATGVMEVPMARVADNPPTYISDIEESPSWGPRFLG